jgi:P4 family phage/plasmid primase-like protien
VTLTAADLRTHEALGITPEMLARMKVRRVDDREARDLLTLNGKPGDLSGVAYAYLRHDLVVTYRVRRDHPDLERGEVKNKYLSAYGDRRYFYLVEDQHLPDATIPALFAEAEKSVLAITCAAARVGRAVLAIGLGGCWGWKARIGKVEAPNGGTVDEHGPLPDFDRGAWTDRDVVIAFDANAATNPAVKAARRQLATELMARGAHVRILDLPTDPGINGPDDFIGRQGDAAFFALVDAAPAACPAVTDRPTEAGAGERFARLHGDAVRFDHRRQRWLVWRGHRWIPDADAAVLRLARECGRAWVREANALPEGDRRESVVKFALRLDRRDATQNVLAWAKATLPIADTGDQWDRDPWLLGAPNGVIDLRTGDLRPGHPDDAITLSTAVAYDPEAPCPRWRQFVNEITGDHRELAAFLQRAIGYSLTGITTEQVLFLLYGTGANGKGNTLKRVLGDYAWNMPFATVELRDRAAIPNDLAALVNRRFVITSETNDGTRLNEARVKALTGSDPITARFLHGEFFEFDPCAKFWLAVNHKPIVKDDSFGFWRRIRLLPFTQRFAVDPTGGRRHSRLVRRRRPVMADRRPDGAGRRHRRHRRIRAGLRPAGGVP